MITVQKGSSKISWISKSKAYHRAGDDVSINVSGKTADTVQASIIFCNQCYIKFKSGYVMFGISGSRLYFVDSNDRNGYKLTDPTGGYSRYVKSAEPTLVDWCKNHRGDYAIELDADEHLWYIETNREA